MRKPLHAGLVAYGLELLERLAILWLHDVVQTQECVCRQTDAWMYRPIVLFLPSRIEELFDDRAIVGQAAYA